MLRKLSNNFDRHAKRVIRAIDRLPRQAYDEFKKETPIDTGNARRQTRFTNTNSGGSIFGNYNYANRLNAGYSKQSPDGMTEPTIAEIRKQLGRAIR